MKNERRNEAIQKEQDVWDEMYDAWITRIVARFMDYYLSSQGIELQNVAMLLNDEDLKFAKECWEWERKEVKGGYVETKELMDKFGKSIIKTK